MDLIKNFDFAEFDHDKILENVTPILLPERNVTSDQVSCKVSGMEDVRMLFAICQDEKLYLLTKKALMREKVLLEEMTDPASYHCPHRVRTTCRSVRVMCTRTYKRP